MELSTTKEREKVVRNFWGWKGSAVGGGDGDMWEGTRARVVKGLAPSGSGRSLGRVKEDTGQE